MVIQKKFDLLMYKDKFIRYLKRKNYSVDTICGYNKDLTKFSKFLSSLYEGSILTEEITKNDILDYMDFLEEDAGFKVNSISRNLSTLKSFFKFLVYELDFDENPAEKIRTPKNFIPLPQILDFDEMNCLLESAKSHSLFYYGMLCLIYYTGTRITAARTLKKQHVDIKNGRLYFPYIKGGRDLYLPLHPKLSEVLDDLMESNQHNGSDYVFQSPKILNHPISAGDIRHNLKKIVKMSGITKRVTPHIIRHSVATHLTLLGVDQTYIAAILGHVDLRSTKRYQHLQVDNLKSAVEKLT
ncbi:tyrosine-type recombinase/integrase [Metabacillus litoralis]|uniref:tyrosine-type recombinase/integrase n=1 Tax=Metabacillus litoralis TaxID=152268 RepID=UPI001B956BE7|nr:tyrosine-type recombinase/integrase [Metabacillus litoralis]MCM3162723.1 tyrosine-type recombinase/integrase [Metabacillus litoralis]UHA60665.1 tyrosine-type recombinase/integrase [Metabacillus litoralis]